MEKNDLISRYALLIHLRKKFHKLKDEQFAELMFNAMKEEIESFPATETVDDVLERLPFGKLEKTLDGGFEAFTEDTPEGYYVAHGKTALEAALNLEALLKSK